MEGNIPCPNPTGFRDCGCNPKIHVSCDKNCGALLEPETLAEYKNALEHAKYHQWLSGCSHGS